MAVVGEMLFASAVSLRQFGWRINAEKPAVVTKVTFATEGAKRRDENVRIGSIRSDLDERVGRTDCRFALGSHSGEASVCI
jgi:hypothetical protein